MAKKNTNTLAIAGIAAAVLVVGFLVAGPFYQIQEGQQSVVTQFGEAVGTETTAGLKFKFPLIQEANLYPKKIMSWDGEPQLIPTQENQFIWVDSTARWRITDPSQYIRNVGLDENAGSVQLARVVRNAFQEEINKRTVKELLSLKREELLADVKREVLAAVKGSKPWGVDVIDVRITRADYVDAITESVYRRMEAERKRVANELRSTGAAEGEKIRADADRQREVTVANAYREAQKIKGEGDAEAAHLYADSFGRDANFAQFYRSLEAYKTTFSKKSDVMVVDPSSDFFKALRGSGSAPAPKK
jgi:membrane protease subunit HflC